jgi:xylitol oxidase
MRYVALTRLLNERGYALPALASLPHLSVAGACATATHGSGDANANMATRVSAMEFVDADGEVRTVRRDDDGFCGCVVSLGALGVVTKLTLDVIPAFDMRQYVYEGLPAQRLIASFEEIFASAHSVSVFTTWEGARHRQAWLKRRLDADDGWRPRERWMDATLADRQLHPIPGGRPEHCTQQLGVPGPWHERLPHFLAQFTPSSGQELQSEYLLPRVHAAEAIEAVASLGSMMRPVLQICEIRTIAADDLWLSPSYQRDTVAFHFTWLKDPDAVAPVVGALEERLAPYAARPHWGKVFQTAPKVVDSLYPRARDFRALLREYDPAGKFRNPFIAEYFPA